MDANKLKQAYHSWKYRDKLEVTYEKYNELKNLINNNQNSDHEFLYYKGKILFHLSQYNAGIKCFITIPSSHALYNRALYYVGMSYYKLDNYYEALEYFHKIPPSYNSFNKIAQSQWLIIESSIIFDRELTHESYYDNGVCSYKTQEYNDAIEEFIKIPPLHTLLYNKAVYHIGMSYYKYSILLKQEQQSIHLQEQSLRSAVKYFKKVPNTDDENYSNSLYYRGIIYQSLGKYTKSFKVLSQILNTHPKFQEAQPYLDEAEARMNIYNLLSSDDAPGDTEPYYWFIELHKYREAHTRLVQVQQQIVANPTMYCESEYDDMEHAMAKVSYKLEQYNDSQSYFMKDLQYGDHYYYFIKIESKTNSNTALQNIFKVLRNADKHHNKYYDACYKYVEAYYHLSPVAESQIDQDLIQSMIARIKKIVQTVPISHHRYYEIQDVGVKILSKIALILYEEEAYDKALEYYKLIYPHSDNALHYMGKIFYKQMNYHSALYSFISLTSQEYKAKVQADYMDTVCTIARSLYERKDHYYNKALEYYKLIYPHSDNASYYMGKIFYKQMNYDLALKHFQKVSRDSTLYDSTQNIISFIDSSKYRLYKWYQSVVDHYTSKHILRIHLSVQDDDRPNTLSLLRHNNVKNEGNHTIALSIMYTAIKKIVEHYSKKDQTIKELYSHMFNHMLSTLILHDHMNAIDHYYYDYLHNCVQSNDLSHISNNIVLMEKRIIPFIMYIWNKRVTAVYHQKKIKGEYKNESKNIKNALDKLNMQEGKIDYVALTDSIILSLDIPDNIKNDDHNSNTIDKLILLLMNNVKQNFVSHLSILNDFNQLYKIVINSQDNKELIQIHPNVVLNLSIGKVITAIKTLLQSDNKNISQECKDYLEAIDECSSDILIEYGKTLWTLYNTVYISQLELTNGTMYDNYKFISALHAVSSKQYHCLDKQSLTTCIDITLLLRYREYISQNQVAPKKIKMDDTIENIDSKITTLLDNFKLLNNQYKILYQNLNEELITQNINVIKANYLYRLGSDLTKMVSQIIRLQLCSFNLDHHKSMIDEYHKICTPLKMFQRIIEMHSITFHKSFLQDEYAHNFKLCNDGKSDILDLSGEESHEYHC